MTCIAGIVNNGNVHIGGDSAGVAGLDLQVRSDAKVFINGSFIFGFTSSFRMGQLLRYDFAPPARPENMSVDKFMVSVFTRALRECLKAGGFAKIKDNVEDAGTFLVGFRGRLFQIADDFQVGEAADGFDAVGCGGPYARAVLYETRNSKLSARARILHALAAAERFSAGVRRPFIVKRILTRKL